MGRIDGYVYNFITEGVYLCVYVGLMMVSLKIGCSKNPVNQATAKATLTQMINIVLRRMESDVEVIGGTCLNVFQSRLGSNSRL